MKITAVSRAKEKTTRSTISFLHSSTAVTVRLPPTTPSPRFPLVAALGVLCCEALPARLRPAPVPSRHEAVRRVDDPLVPVPALLSRPRP